MMQIDGNDYYQRATAVGGPRCCSGRASQQQVATTMAGGATDRSLRISTTLRGAELLCCCCSCSTTTSAKSPGLVASLGVCLLVFGYTLLGAFAFMALEGGFKTGGSSLHQELASVTAAVPGSSATSTNTLVKNGKIESSPRPGERSGVFNSNNLTGALNPPGVTTPFLETTSARPVPAPNLVQTNHRADIILEESSARLLRAHTVERLWSITEDLNVLYKENWTRLAEQEVLVFQEKLAAHSLDRARSGSSIYGTTAVQRAGSTSTGRRNNDKRLPGGLSPLIKHNQQRWTFGSSFLYSITLITTIGYGSTSPRTAWGRLITIIYALAGIPLMLVYLSTIGDVLARNFRRLYGRVCGRVECIGDGNGGTRGGGCQGSSGSSVPPTVPGIIGKTSYHRYDNHIDSKLSAVGANNAHHQFYSSKSSSSDELGLIRSTGSGILLDCSGEAGSAASGFQESNSGQQGTKKHHHQFYTCSSQLSEPSAVCLVRIPISLCLLIILLYICCGALMFNRLEGWSFLEGSYFCFTSLGTIGFGDLVPSGGKASSHLLEELSLCACSLYILAGMGLMAMCFNLMEDEVVRVVRVFGRTCGMSPINNCAGARMINNPPPPPPPPSATTGSTGIKSDLGTHVDRDFMGPACTANVLSNDSRLGVGQHNYERREGGEDEEAIAMSLVASS